MRQHYIKASDCFQKLLFQSHPGGASGKESKCQCRRYRRYSFNPWVGEIPWKRKWQPIQYSCQGNPIFRGAWWATVHGVTKSWM